MEFVAKNNNDEESDIDDDNEFENENKNQVDESRDFIHPNVTLTPNLWMIHAICQEFIFKTLVVTNITGLK